MRSYKRYILKFILGTEIFYFLCLIYGEFLSGPAAELHRALFGVAVPGFIWGSTLSIIWGAILWAIFGGLIAWFINWMHNSSLVDLAKDQAIPYSYTKKVALPFEQAIIKIKEALAKEGFGVLTEIDVKATLKKKLEVEYTDYVILGACNPQFAYQALQTEKEIGLFLPCNVIVYVESGKVFVSAVLPSVAMSMIANNSLLEIAGQVEKKLIKVMDNLDSNL